MRIGLRQGRLSISFSGRSLLGPLLIVPAKTGPRSPTGLNTTVASRT